MKSNKEQFKDLINSHINQHGYHITVVGGAIEPRYAYTIGLTRLFNFELVFAGGLYYMKDDVLRIFTEVIAQIKKNNGKITNTISTSTLGRFSLTIVDNSWCKLMLQGLYDYYKTNNVFAIQIIPELSHFTLDIPDMSKKWNFSEPVWKWIKDEWNYPVPKNSIVTTNIDALKGGTITEVMRWEVDQWEMFTGPSSEFKDDDMRVVSLGTILGIDESLFPAINLSIGKGLWRECKDTEWNQWG